MNAVNDARDLYLEVRAKEGRLYPDDIVKQLPNVPASHPLAAEWRARDASSRRLAVYLAGLGEGITILELGCGNGWLARRMADGARASVVGLDRDNPELWQARRVFADNPALNWVAADIFSAPFSRGRFDIIVIASAIQYFPDLSELIQALSPLVRPHGEIHILDSRLYSAEELPAARERSRRYYERLGFPEMATHYHHHELEVLEPYHPVWLYRPTGQDSPFPWMCLRV